MLKAGQYDVLRNELGVSMADVVVATMHRKKQRKSEMGYDDDFSDDGESDYSYDEDESEEDAEDDDTENDYLSQLEQAAIIASTSGLKNSGYDQQAKMLSLANRPPRRAAPVESPVIPPVSDMPRLDTAEWRSKPPLTWKPRHVSDWLQTQGDGYIDLANVLVMHEIDGPRLLDLSESTMSKMNIKKVQRRELRGKIKELSSASNRGVKACESYFLWKCVHLLILFV